MNFETYQKQYRDRLESFLKKILPNTNITTDPTPLSKALEYSVLNGGKRLRPLLVYATGEALSAEISHLDAAAAAVELIHCYSLIHDDLPALDNDDLRRGKPTCHKMFNEATAILAGDALQTLAFQILSDPKLNPISSQQQIQMITILAKNIGPQGMIEGQMLDMGSEKKAISLDTLKTMHQKKTGALIKASILLGATAAKCEDPKKLNDLQKYADCIGLAFQIQDDILDVIGDSKMLGKNPGQDIKQNKATFPALMGLEEAKQYAMKLHEEAMTAIEFLENKAQFLEYISLFFIQRIY